MKVESIFKIIINNWVAKCICLGSAIILFLFVRSSGIEKRTISVPLVVDKESELICLYGVPQTVNVTYRTDSKNITNISSQDISAKIDFSRYKEEGTYDVPVELAIKPDIISIEPIELVVTPDRYKVRLEKKVRKSVIVNAKTFGEPLHGYVLDKIEYEPNFVIISGPRSIIESVNFLDVDDINLQNRNNNFSVTKELRSYNKNMNIVSNNLIKCNVSFMPNLTERNFYKIPVEFVNLDSKFEVTALFEVDLTLYGAELSLEKYVLPEKSVTVDCSEIKNVGEFELPVNVSVTNSFELRSQSLSTCKFTVSEKKVETGSEG